MKDRGIGARGVAQVAEYLPKKPKSMRSHAFEFEYKPQNHQKKKNRKKERD
jgi:hypothetical protein